MDWWPYPTNFSNGTEVNGTADFFVTYPSFILSGWFGAGITLIVFIMSFALSMMLGSRKAFMVASLIAGLFSIYFIRLNAINPVITIVLFILAIIGAIGGKEEGSSL